jgi:hypothetical protein
LETITIGELTARMATDRPDFPAPRAANGRN